jgi:hypothetical protein
LLLVCVALIAIGVHAHAWPLMFKRSLNPNYNGPGSGSRIGRLMVQIDGDRSSAMGSPRLADFPWAGSASWTWSPPECGLLVVYPGDRVVERNWAISWPSYYPKSAVVGVFQAGPGAATTVAVHGAWLWGIGLAGIVGLSFAPARRAWRRRGRKPWSCATCGYDLRGTASAMPCPECGSARGDSAPGSDGA